MSMCECVIWFLPDLSQGQCWKASLHPMPVFTMLLKRWSGNWRFSNSHCRHLIATVKCLRLPFSKLSSLCRLIFLQCVLGWPKDAAPLPQFASSCEGWYSATTTCKEICQRKGQIWFEVGEHSEREASKMAKEALEHDAKPRGWFAKN